MIWRIKCLWDWLVEYITLTPKKYDEVIFKLGGLLCHATGGRYSKANYGIECMERMVTDYIEECCEYAVAEALADEAYRNDAEKGHDNQKVEINAYDKEEIYHDCTVQVLTNTVTGEVSIGWWRNEKKPKGWRDEDA